MLARRVLTVWIFRGLYSTFILSQWVPAGETKCWRPCRGYKVIIEAASGYRNRIKCQHKLFKWHLCDSITGKLRSICFIKSCWTEHKSSHLILTDNIALRSLENGVWNSMEAGPKTYWKGFYNFFSVILSFAEPFTYHTLRLLNYMTIYSLFVLGFLSKKDWKQNDEKESEERINTFVMQVALKGSI